ncbi:MAG: methyltransferase [Armatimonadetes bacterium]|nr:methyltransferase [Armatimonadota bacterium]
MRCVDRPVEVNQLTSRDRVLAALRHEESDRVPIDMGGMISTGITASAYIALRDYLGLDGTARVYDWWQQLAAVDPDVLEYFHVDSVDLANTRVAPGGNWHKWTLPSNGVEVEVPDEFCPEKEPDGGWIVRNEDGEIVGRMPQGGLYFDGTEAYHELRHATSVNDVEKWEIPPAADTALDSMAERAKWLYENTGWAILAMSPGSVFGIGQAMRGWEQYMVDLLADPALASAIIEKAVACFKRDIKRLYDAVGDYIQIVVFADDLGTQAGPQISPETYRKMILPGQKDLFGYAKRLRPEIYVFLHCCGSCYDLVPGLIDAGVDILNPVQTSAARMDPKVLKREFGKHITFWGGGCDTQRILPWATPEQIRAHVKERIEIFAPGGGFVFNQVHNIQANVPPENIAAMLEAAYDFGIC